MSLDPKYGEGFLRLDKDRCRSLAEILPMSASALPEVKMDVWALLEQHWGIFGGSEAEKPDKSGCIVLDNPGWISAGGTVLSAVQSYLVSRGVRPRNTNVVITSTLDSGLMVELPRALSEEIEELGCHVSTHVPSRSEEVVSIGQTASYSTPVELDRTYVESDVRIVIASARPSLITGVSAGPVSILPGLAAERSRIKNRRLALGNMGLLSTDTPCARDAVECAIMAGPCLAVNSIPDWTGNCTKLIVGSPESAWCDDLNSCRGLAEASIPRLFDIAVVSAGGTPRDLTLYDSVDALAAGVAATRRDGVVVLVTECSQGCGPDGFLRGVSENSSSSEVLLSSELRYLEGMEKAWYFWRVLESRRVVLCTRLRAGMVVERLHSEHVKDPDEGVEVALTIAGQDSTVAVIPDGGSTVPVLGRGM
ncbi:MAG: DUF2088 domain-containing protein [Candidatus Thorarchaeota archaeon]|nr:DUF2088 domain-containing protein [Candidatus Thorarchaeota archaeon]